MKTCPKCKVTLPTESPESRQNFFPTIIQGEVAYVCAECKHYESKKKRPYGAW